jgi:hypothetical protein
MTALAARAIRTYQPGIGTSGESRDSNKTAELPGIEVAYGLTANTALGFVLPRQVSTPVRGLAAGALMLRQPVVAYTLAAGTRYPAKGK